MTKALIPAGRAQIEWAENDNFQIADVIVFDRDTPPDHRERSKLDNSSGACGAGWLSDPRQTPEGVFAEMARSGFAGPDALKEALLEFGKIQTCPWARKMAAALA
jgi:hypothetical protein